MKAKVAGARIPAEDHGELHGDAAGLARLSAAEITSRHKAPSRWVEAEMG